MENDIFYYINYFADNNLVKLQSALFVIVIVVGLITFIVSFSGFVQINRAGGSGNELVAPVFGILASVIMVSLAYFGDVFSYSLFGSEANPLIIDTWSEADTPFNTALKAIVGLLALVGWYCMYKVGDTLASGPKYNEPRYLRKALVYAGVGVILLNFPLSADVLGNSIGSTQFGTEYFTF